jgi:sugar O-acyltransferase (sialic acid O-acetyltransferase NeuD family)
VGQVIALLETSKAAFEIEAPHSGFIHYIAGVGEHVPVNAPLATISSTPNRPLDIIAPAQGGRIKGGQTVFSKAAEKIIAQLGLDARIFTNLPVVRAEDVEAYVKNREALSGKETPLALDLPAIKTDHILIWGGGGHTKVCIEILRLAQRFEIYGIIDATIPIGKSLLGVPVVGRESAMEELYRRGLKRAVVGIGAVANHQMRKEYFERLKGIGFDLPNLIDPRAAVDPSVVMGEGNQVFANATISADVRIGNGCIINAGTVVSHDCELENNVHLAPGALLAGNVRIGSDTLIGMGATIFLGIRVGRGVRINNNVSVNNDVADGTILIAGHAGHQQRDISDPTM